MPNGDREPFTTEQRVYLAEVRLREIEAAMERRLTDLERVVEKRIAGFEDSVTDKLDGLSRSVRNVTGFAIAIASSLLVALIILVVSIGGK